MPRITVAFNIAPEFNVRPWDPTFYAKWVWEELFSAAELQQMKERGERWAIMTQRPPNRYTQCMADGNCDR